MLAGTLIYLDLILIFFFYPPLNHCPDQLLISSCLSYFDSILIGPSAFVFSSSSSPSSDLPKRHIWSRQPPYSHPPVVPHHPRTKSYILWRTHMVTYNLSLLILSATFLSTLKVLDCSSLPPYWYFLFLECPTLPCQMDELQITLPGGRNITL